MYSLGKAFTHHPAHASFTKGKHLGISSSPKRQPASLPRQNISLDLDDIVTTQVSSHSQPSSPHYRIIDNFLPNNLATNLCSTFQSTFDTPLQPSPDRFCFDPWYVPGQYSLLRTQAEYFFPEDQYQDLIDALIAFGESQLGCQAISPPWLSLYTDGHRQELHTDSPHGPWAFVLSLTPWYNNNDDRCPYFKGGDTQLLQPHVLDYWRHYNPTTGWETPQLFSYIQPRFNRLTLFDSRFPHGVTPVEGTRDPLEGRLVLHGWFTKPAPFFMGGLDAEDATPVINKALDEFYEDAYPNIVPVVGVVTVQIRIDGERGEVTGLKWLTNTLISRPQDLIGFRIDSGNNAEGGGNNNSGGWSSPEEVVKLALEKIADPLLRAKFPSAGEDSFVTLPFIFE
jgi:hypothetical protein